MLKHKRDFRNNDLKSGLSQRFLQVGHLFKKIKILERIDEPACEKFHIKLVGEEDTVELQRKCEAFNSVSNSVMVKISEVTTANE